MIEAFRLGIYSRGKTLWDGLDFVFEDGTAKVIVGPPSCGKTLLLSILRGDLRPDAGDVLVSGESIYRGDGPTVRAFRARSGCVPQIPESGEGLTVGSLFRRSAMMCGSLSQEERKERRERLLSMVGLSGSEDFRLSEMSVSERARVAIAAELLRNPKVLFSDGLAQAVGGEHAEMVGTLFRALAGVGNLIVAAERELPRGWEAIAGPGVPVGPFVVHRLPEIAMKGGSP